MKHYNNTYSVYKHTLPNGKVYIGITCKKPNDRWKNGKGYINQVRFYNAINKYGWENIKHEVLFEGLTKDQAEQKEIELIAEYKSNQREYGYNIANGGLLNIPTQDVIEKIRKAKLGKKHTKKHKEKISASMRGRILSVEHKEHLSIKFKGRKMSQAAKEKMRLSHLGKKMTAENRQKINDAVCKNVYQMQYGEKIKVWESISAAARALNINGSHITECCKGKRKTVGGYGWSYANI